MKTIKKITDIALIGVLSFLCTAVAFALCYISFGLFMFTQPEDVCSMILIVITAGFLKLSAISLVVSLVMYVKRINRSDRNVE